MPGPDRVRVRQPHRPSGRGQRPGRGAGRLARADPRGAGLPGLPRILRERCRQSGPDAGPLVGNQDPPAARGGRGAPGGGLPRRLPGGVGQRVPDDGGARRPRVAAGREARPARPRSGRADHGGTAPHAQRLRGRVRQLVQRAQAAREWGAHPPGWSAFGSAGTSTRRGGPCGSAPRPLATTRTASS